MMTNPMLTILPRTWCLMSPSYNLCGILVINLCQKMIIVEYCYYKFMKVFLVAVLKGIYCIWTEYSLIQQSWRNNILDDSQMHACWSALSHCLFKRYFIGIKEDILIYV